jgi:hypothetical protein
MTPLVARTNAEAHLYMELHPCDTCGETEFAPPSSAVLLDGDLVNRFAGPCPACGTPREFIFRLPGRPSFPDPDEPSFGAAEPSGLIDAGEWLWLADVIASGIPAQPAGMSEEEREQARFDMRTAAAAVGEAMKFLPLGADEVPAEALWNARGRSVYREAPARFRRQRLAAAQRGYRELAERFAG